MPQIIPRYEQRTNATGPTQLAPIDERVASGAGFLALGQAVGNVAQNAVVVREFQQRQAEEKAAVWATDQAMAYRSKWVDQFAQMQQDAPEDGTGFQKSVLEQFDQGAEDMLKEAPTADSRNWLRDQLSRQRLALQEEGSAFELQRGTEFKLNGLARSVDAARISARARPQDFDSLAAEMTATIGASGLSAKAQAGAREKTAEALGSAAVEGMIGRNPYQALKDLNSEKPTSRAVRVLNFDQREQLRRQAQTEINRREAEAQHAQVEAKQALGERVRDATTAYRLGLDFDKPPSRADFVVALGKDEGNQSYENFAKEQQLGSDLQSLAMMAPADQAKVLKDRAPKGTAGVAETAERYRILLAQTQQLNKMREDDPAAYAARYNDNVKSALAQASSSPQAAQAYATSTIAEQKRLGVSQPRILPDEVADGIVQSFYTQGGEQLAGLIAGEQAKWGTHWPQVYGELAAKKMPSAALAIGRGMAPGAATRLAGLATVKMEEMQKGVAIPPKDVTEKLEEQMGDFQRTLDGVVGGESTFAGIYDAAERLTYSYLRSGKSLGDATQQAYREVIGDHYDFDEVHGMTYRVPVQEATDGVYRGAQAALEDVSAADLGTPVVLPQSSEFNARDDYARAIQSRGYWVTDAEGERGLALFVDGSPVLRKDGSVYMMTWDQLRARADESAAAKRRQAAKKAEMSQIPGLR